MKFTRTEQFKKQFKKLPVKIQQKSDKQLLFLSSNFRHPSLHTKKEQGKGDTWEGRIDRFYRFTFVIEGNLIILHTIGPHDQALK